MGVGSEAWKLVAGIWIGSFGGILAVVSVHPFTRACNNGAVRGRGGEFKSVGIPHDDGDGEWAFRRRGIQKSFVFSEPASGGLGQQLSSIVEPHRTGGSSQLLRHSRWDQQRLGQLLLLRRTWSKRQMSLTGVKG